MSYLKDIDENICSRPFTGKRKIPETKVMCLGKNAKDEWFHSSSLLGGSREDFHERLKLCNLTPDKEYVAIEIEGYGDVYDITIKQDDNGNTASFMSIFFEITE